jgi:hypothetical protein
LAYRADTVNTVIDAKGDLLAGTAADTIDRIAVGANNTVLTADSSTATGLKWATAGGGAYTLLSTTTLSSTTTTISGFSSAFTDLMIVIKDPHLVSGTTQMVINPNGTTATSYNSAMSGSTGSSEDRWLSGTNLPTSSTPICSYIGFIYQYSQTSNGKPFEFFGGINTQNNTVTRSGLFGATAAITSLNITTLSGATFNGGTVLLYGVK